MAQRIYNKNSRKLVTYKSLAQEVSDLYKKTNTPDNARITLTLSSIKKYFKTCNNKGSSNPGIFVDYSVKRNKTTKKYADNQNIIERDLWLNAGTPPKPNIYTVTVKTDGGVQIDSKQVSEGNNYISTKDFSSYVFTSISSNNGTECSIGTNNVITAGPIVSNTILIVTLDPGSPTPTPSEDTLPWHVFEGDSDDITQYRETRNGTTIPNQDLVISNISGEIKAVKDVTTDISSSNYFYNEGTDKLSIYLGQNPGDETEINVYVKVKGSSQHQNVEETYSIRNSAFNNGQTVDLLNKIDSSDNSPLLDEGYVLDTSYTPVSQYGPSNGIELVDATHIKVNQAGDLSNLNNFSTYTKTRFRAVNSNDSSDAYFIDITVCNYGVEVKCDATLIDFTGTLDRGMAIVPWSIDIQTKPTGVSNHTTRLVFDNVNLPAASHVNGGGKGSNGSIGSLGISVSIAAIGSAQALTLSPEDGKFLDVPILIGKLGDGTQYNNGDQYTLTITPTSGSSINKELTLKIS